MVNMDISIVIVNYKSKGLVLKSIQSIKGADFGFLQKEIIVVDNDSSDGVGKEIEALRADIKFISNRENIGMGAGNNVGIKAARGKYIVIMNPDTVVFPDTFVKLYDFMEINPAVGMAGPKQYSPDMIVQDSCYRWYGPFTTLYRRTPLKRLRCAQKDIDRFIMKDFDHNSTKEVDWLMGSFLFCRADALKQIGYFDERFFLYFEDTDLAKRFWQNNWKVIYYPDAGITHYHARQSAQAPWYKFFSTSAGRYHFISWVKYLLKWVLK